MACRPTSHIRSLVNHQSHSSFSRVLAQWLLSTKSQMSSTEWSRSRASIPNSSNKSTIPDADGNFAESDISYLYSKIPKIKNTNWPFANCLDLTGISYAEANGKLLWHQHWLSALSRGGPSPDTVFGCGVGIIILAGILLELSVQLISRIASVQQIDASLSTRQITPHFLNYGWIKQFHSWQLLSKERGKGCTNRFGCLHHLFFGGCSYRCVHFRLIHDCRIGTSSFLVLFLNIPWLG